MKKHLSTIILVLVFITGILVLLYPTVSDWWNSRVQTTIVNEYKAAVESMSEEDYTAEFEKADAYNAALRELSYPWSEYDQVSGYEDILDVGNGVIGYISIPSINIKLPIYHGTSYAVLSVAVGHLEGSSLPVGGEGTHTVLSAHRGLPSARLFTDLDELTEGDTFTITVLNRLLTYEVDQIRIIEPNDTSELEVVPGKDYCTLMTCTPYGINTQRLLVRGHRVANAQSSGTVENEADELDSILFAPVVAVPILVVLLVVLLTKTSRRKRRKK